MIWLVLGGTRSGKSAIAERLVTEHAGITGQDVTYVAVGAMPDAGMAERIGAHRRRRPSEWATVEVYDHALLAPAVAAIDGLVLLDSLGGWVTTAPAGPVEVEPLLVALAERRGDAVVVSEEVGMSVHPVSESGRRFVDALGETNQAVAAVADRVMLVVAGRTLEL